MCILPRKDQKSEINIMKKMTQRPPAAVCFLICEITVEPVLFLYMLSTFSQYALFQDLVYSKVCWAQFNRSICDNLHEEIFKEELEYVQETSSHWILMSTITLVIPSLLISIYLGSWSDRFGRKWPVVIPPLGGVLSCLVYIFISFKAEAPVAWILFASSLSGLSGGFVSCIMSCMTYVASVSTEENRTERISRLEAMTFLGGTIGPFISGSMLQVTGHGYAFFFMMICYTTACLYAIFLVKDVYDGSARDPALRANNHSPPPVVASEGDASGGGIRVGGGRKDHNQRSLIYSANLEEEDSKCHASTGSTTVTLTTNGHHHPEEEGTVRGNRPSVWSGSSSESNGSTTGSSHGSQSGVTSTHEDDERRNIILSQDTSGWETCCSRYFGSQHFLDVLSTAFKRREENRRLFLILVVFAAFVTMMVTAGELDVAYLFAKDQPLQWSYQTYSYYFGFKYGLGAFMLLIGMPVFLRLQLADTTICLIGILSRMAGLLVYGLSNSTYMAFSVPVVAIFSFFTIPATRALLSKIVAASEHGKMFSFVAIMEDLCTLSASLVFNSLYPHTRQLYRGSIFFLAAGLLFIPLVLIWYVRNKLVLTSLSLSSSPTPSLPSNHSPEPPGGGGDGGGCAAVQIQATDPEQESSPLINNLIKRTPNGQPVQLGERREIQP